MQGDMCGFEECIDVRRSGGECLICLAACGQTFKESESKMKELQEQLSGALREKEVLEGRVREMETEQAAKREAVGDC